MSVTQTSNDHKIANLQSTFYLTEEVLIDNQIINNLTKTYNSNFSRDQFGRFLHDKKAFMPVVRNVPVFPDRKLSVGDSWVNSGYEVHDFRGSPLYMNNPYSFPILVNYKYVDNKYIDGRKMALISISYTVFHKNKLNDYTNNIKLKRIIGQFDQLLVWDLERGEPKSYKEKFNLVMELSTGDEIEFKGTAEAVVIRSKEMDKENLADEIRQNLKDSGIKKFNITPTDEGLSLELNDINFYPDSTNFLPNENNKLEKIAKVLKMFPDRDLLIVGHTALSGTQKERLELSKNRALSVANYIISRGVRNNEQIIVEGKGALVPMYSNSTKEGMMKNRRVEIIILEN